MSIPMPALIDLALGRSATQSSKHPDIVLPLSQVAGEAVQPAHSDSSFHTASEWFPWWQVDLESVCRIEKVILSNTDYWPIRSKMFTILVSIDGEAWLEVYSRTDHTLFGGDEDSACEVSLTTPAIARFVRIRLDNWNPLHLKRVQVLGRTLDASLLHAPKRRVFQEAAGPTVFATNFNEEDGFLETYIENFLHFTGEDCHLIVNFPASREIPDTALTGHPRVHVFNGRVSRSKWGGTLLLGHIESYGEALRVVPKFAYFCTCASNGLFVRPFNASDAIRQTFAGNVAPVGMTRHFLIDVPLDDIPPGEAWVWDNMRASENLRRYLVDEADIPLMSLNQIEGLFATREEWNTLYKRLPVLEACAACFPDPVQSTPALEEFLPVTFFRRFGDGRFTNICHMLWDPIRELTFPDLVAFSEKLPAHMCQVKWFSRDADSMPTAAISRDWSRALLAALSSEPTPSASHEWFRNRALACHFHEAMKIQEYYTPLTRAWRTDARWGRVQWLIATTLHTGDTQDIPGIPEASAGSGEKKQRSVAWLKGTPQLHRDMEVEAILAEDGHATTLTLNAAPVGRRPGQHEWSESKAHLFLSPLQSDKAQVFRVSLTRPFKEATAQLLMSTQRSDGVTESAWPPVLQEDEGDRRHFYFLRPHHHLGGIWIGIPMFENTSIQLELSFGIVPV
ncbi:hypothetical protein P792_01235 [Asaia sp. SF2.1]|nr:hypothetical protein P792_01235 [Asaia sp. SF2.1]